MNSYYVNYTIATLLPVPVTFTFGGVNYKCKCEFYYIHLKKIATVQCITIYVMSKVNRLRRHQVNKFGIE